MAKRHYNYYEWLTNEDYGEYCKRKLVELYEDFYYEQDKKFKSEKLKQIEIYLAIVCDVIAYRYLVKYYTNLFYQLCITVEEYMDYKVERLMATLREKKEHIDDILSYIYMSFMLSSPRLIYDYGEKIGHCKTIRENLPYYQVVRNKFFNNIKTETIEHIVFNVDTLYLDDTKNSEETNVRSNIDKYSYVKWKDEQENKEGNEQFESLIAFIQKQNFEYVKSKEYLLDIFKNWKTKIESDYNAIKLKLKAGNNYSLIDYIKYKYENGEINLNYDEYLDVLAQFNNILKLKERA